MTDSYSLFRTVSPPPLKRQRLRKEADPSAPDAPSPAIVETGAAQISDQLSYFATHLGSVVRSSGDSPRISIADFKELYIRNDQPNGRHFVVHQHDHPIAGTHYDLRLQFSGTSSMSFSIPYGLPGNPNSKRPGRLAIETRVHNLWNHLIESAGAETGSLLIWDTGEYTVVPDRDPVQPETDDDLSDASMQDPKYEKPAGSTQSEPEKLVAAFQNRHIRLRLHGVRLPPNYTVSMRLSSLNDSSTQPAASARTRIIKPRKVKRRQRTPSLSPPSSHVISKVKDEIAAATAAAEDVETRRTNAYPGADNSIGSVHQRQWYLNLNHARSGFVREKAGAKKGRWVRDKASKGEGQGASETGGFDPFFVLGTVAERSVVTGRTSAEVLQDEGTAGFVPRGNWQPVLV